jgi:hypothetical protein
LKKATGMEAEHKLKDIQSKLNNMHVVEYDSDYIHSGEEDTKQTIAAANKKIRQKPTTQRKQREAINKLLRREVPDAENETVSVHHEQNN